MDIKMLGPDGKDEPVTPTKWVNLNGSQKVTAVENGQNTWRAWLEKRKVASETKKIERKKLEEEEDDAPKLSILHLFRHSTSVERIIISLGIIFASLMGCTLPITLIMFGDVTQAFVDLAENITHADESAQTRFMEEALKYGINMGIVSAIQVAMGYVFVFSFSYTAEKQIYLIRRGFLKAMLRQDVGWYDTHATTDFCSKITENLTKLQEGIGEKAVICMYSISTCLICFGVAFYYGWKLTLVILSTVPLMIGSNVIAAKVQATLVQQELLAYSRAGSVAEEVLVSIKTVVAFGGQKKEAQRYADRLVYAKEASLRRAIVSGLGNGIFWFMIYASYALAFWYGIKLILDGRADDDPEYNAASLTIVFLCLLLGSLLVGMASPYFETLASAQVAAASIFDVMERFPVIDSTSDKGLRPDKFVGVIEFCNVHFNYPSRPEVKILQGLNLKVYPGETVALVGGSGCGKSTILQLLQRFYDPLGGTVKVDGVDIKELNVQWLRSHFGVVGQEPVLFGTSIGANIRMGKEGVSQTDVEMASRQANAHDFIMQLPEQYETLVGERGAQLSGGQKQRVAIARALVRDPQILLLDEATSALDLRSEAVVQKALDVAKEGRTTFIVAHRLSTIRSADRILVLSDGNVKEEGTHETLMETQRIYYHLVTAQLPTVLEEEAAEEANGDCGLPSMERLQSITSASSVGVDISGSTLPDAAQVTGEAEVLKLSLWKILKANLPEWPYILVGTIASAAQGFSMPIYAVIFGEIIGTLAMLDDDAARSYGNYYSLLFIAVGVLSGLGIFFQFAMFTISGDKLTLRLREKTFAAMLQQEIGWYDDPKNSSGALCSRLSSDAASVQGATGNRIGTLFQGIFGLAVAVIMSVYLSWKLGVVSSLMVPLVVLGSIWENKLIMDQNFSEKLALERASRTAMEAITNVRTVASLCRQQTFLDMYTKCLEKPHAKAKRNAHLRGLVYGFSQAMPNVGYGVTITYGAYLVLQDGIDFTTVFKVSEALVVGAMVVGQALAFAPNYSKGRVAAAKIFQLLERIPKIVDSEPFTDPMAEVNQGHIQFEGVKFNYPSRAEEMILKGINLNVEEGKRVALVGTSGCGKSTCIQLLLRFYDALSGKILS